MRFELYSSQKIVIVIVKIVKYVIINLQLVLILKTISGSNWHDSLITKMQDSENVINCCWSCKSRVNKKDDFETF